MGYLLFYVATALSLFIGNCHQTNHVSLFLANLIDFIKKSTAW